MRLTRAGVVLGTVLLAMAGTHVWTGCNRPDQTPPEVRPTPSVAATRPKGADDEGRIGQVDGSLPRAPMPSATRRLHPLLKEAAEVVLADSSHEVQSTASAELGEVIRAIARSARGPGPPDALTIDCPLDESVFPPEIVPPTFLWHEHVERVDTWLLELSLASDAEHIHVLSPGDPPPTGQIDARCITKTNEVYQGTPYQASAKAWKANGEVWTAVKRRSVGRLAKVTILGFHSADPAKALSRGHITITTSKDPVGAPIFYRDVPLAPSSTQEGVIKPLSEAFLPLIAWRLRDVSKSESRLLLTDLLTCTNCHSFSADGKTLGMDLDGPKGDKGAYVIAPVAKETVIEQKHVVSWNSYAEKPKDRKTIGFLSRLSPDGQYAVTTLNEAVYVENFTDYRFLQVFYPTRGILGYDSRANGQIKALPGADDPKHVHCDPAWSPDGAYLVFARAEAKDPYPTGYRPAARPNDPAEPQIQYSLYRIPFCAGRGGRPEPIAGASHNGMSNTFPKVSPDGKWIVFSSKANTPYTQMFLTHVEDDGSDSPAVLIPDSTAANRAVNLPEFVNVSYDGTAVGQRDPAVHQVQHGLAAEQPVLQRQHLEREKRGHLSHQLPSGRRERGERRRLGNVHLGDHQRGQSDPG